VRELRQSDLDRVHFQDKRGTQTNAHDASNEQFDTWIRTHLLLVAKNEDGLWDVLEPQTWTLEERCILCNRIRDTLGEL
jgi:hypothetical protein